MWSLAALIWAPWNLSHCLICIQICFFVPDPFFVDPCTNNFGLKIQFLLSAPRHLGFRSFFSQDFCAKTNFDQARKREQHKHHDKESLSMIFFFLVVALALSSAHVKKHTTKKTSGYAGNQKPFRVHIWPSLRNIFVRSTWTRGQDLRAGTPKPLANVLCRLAKKFGKSVHHT